MGKNKCSGCWAVAVIDDRTHCAAPKCHKDNLTRSAEISCRDTTIEETPLDEVPINQIAANQVTSGKCVRSIRQLLVEGDDMLKGVVEVDETYIGGKHRRDQTSKRDDEDDQPKGRGGSRKMMAVAAVERDGRAKCRT